MNAGFILICASVSLLCGLILAVADHPSRGWCHFGTCLAWFCTAIELFRKRGQTNESD